MGALAERLPWLSTACGLRCSAAAAPWERDVEMMPGTCVRGHGGGGLTVAPLLPAREGRATERGANR